MDSLSQIVFFLFYISIHNYKMYKHERHKELHPVSFKRMETIWKAVFLNNTDTKSE